MIDDDTLPWPLVLSQGDTWTVEIQWTDSDDVPVDLTGCEAAMQFRRDFAHSVVLEASTADGRMTIDGPDGRINVSIDKDTMAAIKLSAGVLDLKLTYPDGVRTTLLRGRFELKYEVTYGN